jgi:hypothetical protein
VLDQTNNPGEHLLYRLPVALACCVVLESREFQHIVEIISTWTKWSSSWRSESLLLLLSEPVSAGPISGQHA